MIATVRLFDTEESGSGSSTLSTAVEVLAAAKGESLGAPRSIVVVEYYIMLLSALKRAGSSWLFVEDAKSPF